MSRTVFLTSRRKGASGGPEGSDSDSDAAEEAARVRTYPASVPDEVALNALERLKNPQLGFEELARAAEKLRVASVVSDRIQTPERETVDTVLGAMSRTGYALALARSEIARFWSENANINENPAQTEIFAELLRNVLGLLQTARALLWLFDQIQTQTELGTGPAVAEALGCLAGAGRDIFPRDLGLFEGFKS